MDSCPGLRCKAPVDLMLGQLWRSWAVLQCRVESLKASMSHKEAEWRDFVIRVCKNIYFSACYNFYFLVK